MSPLRGIRGAVQAAIDTPGAIDAATRELLREMVARNDVAPEGLLAIWFTQTPDLTAAHAAASARALGWRHVPLLGGQEAPVAGQLERVVRALMIADLDVNHGAVRHVYLGATRELRGDLNEMGACE
ncbi:MAG TPA: chorismate mutase [Gemmatimonadota bacterium]|nr:chorismate mutase [Gemmatimonadota bacterium]